MNIGILCRKSEKLINEFIKCLQKRGVDVQAILLDELKLSNEPVGKDFDGVIVRGGPGLLESQEIFEFLFLTVKTFEFNKIPVMNNSEAILNSTNKFLTSLLLSKNKILNPRTFVVSNYKEASIISDDIGFPLVVKPLYGAEGKGVLRINNKKELEHHLHDKQKIFYIQEYIPNPGKDIRIYVVGNKVVGGIQRVARKGEWRSNLSLGGIPKKVLLNSNLKKLAINVAKAIKADFTAVDIIESKGKSYVIETNIMPIFSERIKEVAGFDLVETIIDYFISKIQS